MGESGDETAIALDCRQDGPKSEMGRDNANIATARDRIIQVMSSYDFRS